jgi:hypothetical protein
MRATRGQRHDGGAARDRIAAVGLRVLLILPAIALAACSAPAGSPLASSAADRPEPVRAPSLPPGVTLVGLGSGDLHGLLGRPTLVRSERQGQFWRYHLGGCQLDLFLYREARSGTARVVYFDVRPSGYYTPASLRTCAEVSERLAGGKAKSRAGDLPPA